MPQVREAHDVIDYQQGWVEPDSLSAMMEELDNIDLVITVEIAMPKIAGATPAAALFAGWIRTNFGNLSLGIVAVRNIAGTSTWSQHAYGNAVDVMCSGDLHRTIAYAVDANRGPLAIAHLLADPYFPSPLGDHFGHVHADFYPQWGGTPPGHPI